MTIRRFWVLINGLGPNSAVVTFQVGQKYIGGGSSAIRETKTPKESENALDAFFGGKVH